MIISIDTGKAFEKIQHQFMIKIFQNIGIEGTYLNIIKAIYDKVKVNVKSLSRIQLCGDTMWPTRLLHPWDFPGKSTGVGSHFLLQGIFPTLGSNLGLLHCRQMLYRLSHWGKLVYVYIYIYDKPTVNIIVNDEKLKVFPVISGTSQGCPFSLLLLNIV